MTSGRPPRPEETPTRNAATHEQWIEWTKATYPSDHIGAALAMLDRIAVALERTAARFPQPTQEQK